MAEYIDLDKFRSDYGFAKRCADCRRNSYSCGKDYSHSRMEFCGFLDDAEIVDVAPVVHGRWKETDLVELQGTISETMRIPNAGLRCSVCAHAFDKKLLWKDNYCPNCGARMCEVSK